MDDQQILAMIQAIQSTQTTIKENIATLMSENKAVWKRIDEQRSVVESIHSLALTLEKQANVLEKHTETLARVQRDVDELKSKPAKRWENVVSIFVSVLVTAVVTYFVSAAGLK